MIEIQHVTKRYGSKAAVNDVSFDVVAGESLALWGSNGAGKTTLIRCLLGATAFDGVVTVNGILSRTQGKKVRQQIGYVPQSMPLFDMSVGEMVVLMARLRGADPTEGRRLLEQFGLTQTVRHPLASLSGGMRQKLALTLALLGNPPVLAFDEPTANLDVQTQDELVRMLSQLKQQGRTLVFTSHRWSEVRALADTVVHLEAGRLIEKESVASQAMTTDRVSMRLQLPDDQADRASRLLVERGFDVLRNGSYAIVIVQDRDKMAPFRVLAEAGLTIMNFDVEVKE